MDAVRRKAGVHHGSHYKKLKAKPFRVKRC
jgi:hypothetical protein